MIAAYEIGYYVGNEWISHGIISAEREAKYPGTVAKWLKNTQRWEQTKEDAKKYNYVGRETWTHLPGSTIIRELVAR